MYLKGGFSNDAAIMDLLDAGAVFVRKFSIQIKSCHTVSNPL